MHFQVGMDVEEAKAKLEEDGFRVMISAAGDDGEDGPPPSIDDMDLVWVQFDPQTAVVIQARACG